MATLGEYFESEARDCLAQIDRELERPYPSAAELHRAARALRGSAQMARDDRVLRAAGALEAAARALLDHAVEWSDDVGTRARQTIADLRALVDRREANDALENTADAVVARWRDAGVTPAQHAARSAQHAASAGEFRAFAAREVAGIVDALERGVQQLITTPMDREPLKMILRRQRALLGAARLDEIPVVAEILRAVDDLTRVIAKLDVGVKREWLDIYRVAREALKAAVEPLQRDQDPPPTHSLSRLRHMRAELLERYGTGDAVSATHTTAGFTTPTVQQAPLADAPPPADAAPATYADRVDEPLLLAEDDIVADEPEPVLLLEQDAIEPDAELLLLEESGVEEPLLELAETIEGDDDTIIVLEEETLELIAEVEPDTASHDVVSDDAVASADVVPIESLLYDRDDALRRALELRALIAPDHASDPAARDVLDEVFDLINMALR